MSAARSPLRKAAVLLMQASLLSSALAAPMLAAPGPAFAQDDDTPLSVNLANDTAERKPGDKPVAGSLEAGIWTASDKAEQQARTSGERDNDPALNAYVSGVLTRITGPFSGDVRAYVMDRPFFNASMAPNGYTEVWTGLLLRCQTEDELAFVLGHESGHFRHNHVIKTYQAAKSGQDAALAATFLLAVAAAGASANATSYQQLSQINNITSGLIDVVYLGALAAYFSYSRETEGQADAYGLIYMRQAGYFPGAAAQIWRERLDETAASDFEKVRKSPARINVFGDHPLETARVTALAAQDKAANHGAESTRSDADAKAARLAYREHIRPYLGAFLKDDLRRQDYGQTIFIINRLSIDGADLGVLDFYKGEAYRLRAKTGPDGSDLENAVQAYKAALAAPDAPKETNRQLGEVLRRLGDNKEALDALNAYLAAAPTADDAWIVQDEVDTLAKSAPAATQTDTPAAPSATTSSGGTPS